MYKLIIPVLLAMVLPLAATAQSLPMDPAVRSGRLSNGLMYYVKKNAEPQNRAELRLALRAGSLQEDPDQLGLAHFVEHMAFNGTENFEKNELVDFLELAGTRFGADLNAYTSFAETVYMLQARTDSAELLDKGLLILEDWAGGLTFDHEEIDKERGVVISEWRSRLSPEQRMQKQHYPILFKDSRFAERLPIGSTDIIENADYAAVKRFYTDWYRPNLMAIIAVGDFDLDAMEQQIRQRFGKLKNPADPRERKEYSVPLHRGTRSVITTDKEYSFNQVSFSIRFPQLKVEDQAAYRTRLTYLLFNRMMGARLFELQQQPEPPFTFANSGYGGTLGDLDNYSIFAFVGEGKLLSGFKAVLTETMRVKQHGFLETELERQKTQYLKSAEKAVKEKENTKSAVFAEQLVYHYLEDNPMLTAEQSLELLQELLPTISIADINGLLNQWWQDDSRTLLIQAPEREDLELPDTTAFLQLIEKTEHTPLAPYEDKVSDAPLFDKELTTVEITNETYYEDFDVTELELANGVKVVLKPTDFKEDEIRMSAFSPGGHSIYPDSIYNSAVYASSIINQSGLADFSATELMKKMTGKNSAAGPYISELYEGINGSTTPEEVEELLQLVYLYITAPRKDADVLASFKNRQNSILENILDNPNYYFGSVATKIRYNDHPRRKGIPTTDDINAIDMETLFDVYQDRFADAGDFTFVFVGNFEVADLKPLLAKYLGSLPATAREESWKDIGARQVSGVIDTTIVRGEAPKARVEMHFHGAFENIAQNRYDFNAMNRVLSITLREKLREALGGVYGVNVSGNTSNKPEDLYSVRIIFTAAPEMVDTLKKTTLDEIKRLQAEGAKAQDISKVQEMQKQERIKAERENSYWMGQLVRRYQDGMSLDGLKREKYEAYVNALNSEAVQKAAQRYFNFDNYITLILMPESTGQKEK